MNLDSIFKDILKHNVVEKTGNSSVKHVCIFEVKTVLVKILLDFSPGDGKFCLVWLLNQTKQQNKNMYNKLSTHFSWFESRLVECVIYGGWI